MHPETVNQHQKKMNSQCPLALGDASKSKSPLDRGCPVNARYVDYIAARKAGIDRETLRPMEGEIQALIAACEDDKSARRLAVAEKRAIAGIAVVSAPAAEPAETL